MLIDETSRYIIVAWKKGKIQSNSIVEGFYLMKANRKLKRSIMDTWLFRQIKKLL